MQPTHQAARLISIGSRKDPGQAMQKVRTRHAVFADLEQINYIFNYFVSNSTCVWKTKPWSAREREKWFKSHGDAMPIIVAEQAAQVVGWGALSPFQTACTFQRTVANSVYVHHEFQRRGIGRKLLTELVRLAIKGRYRSIIAEISSDQDASVALHKALGFKTVGRLKNVGYKFDRLRDLTYLQLVLGAS